MDQDHLLQTFRLIAWVLGMLVIAVAVGISFNSWLDKQYRNPPEELTDIAAQRIWAYQFISRSTSREQDDKFLAMIQEVVSAEVAERKLQMEILRNEHIPIEPPPRPIMLNDTQHDFVLTVQKAFSRAFSKKGNENGMVRMSDIRESLDHAVGIATARMVSSGNVSNATEAVPPVSTNSPASTNSPPVREGD